VVRPVRWRAGPKRRHLQGSLQNTGQPTAQSPEQVCALRELANTRLVLAFLEWFGRQRAVGLVGIIGVLL